MGLTPHARLALERPNMTNFEQSPTSRRSFLQAGVFGLGTAAVWNALPATSAASVPKRPSGSHMKLSLAAYSFNRMLPRDGKKTANTTMTLEDFIDYCAELNLDGTELTGYYFPAQVTNEYLMSLKQRTFRLGLDISGTAIGNDFCLPEGEARDKQLAYCRTWIDHAAAMGAPVIRIFAGKVPKGDTEEAAIERCARGIDECLDYAAEKGVFLALENHGGITETPAQMLKIIHAVKDSPWFGVNLDGGNFRTDDPYRDLAEIAPYTINAQLKATINGKPADMERIIKILRDVNYRGYVVLEYEERDDPNTAIPRYIKRLRELIS
jgi:sugar phosphate isomerase/epimerase